MKLLTRSEIHTIKASERKAEIDTGLTLAKRIDSLREIFSKEKKEWTVFHSETIALLQKEVDSLMIKRDALDTEIESLTLKRNKDFGPTKKQIKEMIEKAIQNRDESEKILDTARNKMTKTLIQSKLIEKESIKRSNQVTLRERAVIERELEFNKRLLTKY